MSDKLAKSGSPFSTVTNVVRSKYWSCFELSWLVCTRMCFLLIHGRPMNEDVCSPKVAEDTTRCQLCNKPHLHITAAAVEGCTIMWVDKQIEQKQRDTAAPIKANHTRHEFQSNTPIKGNWRENVISCRTCKHSLVKFIGDHILHDIQSHLAPNQKCYVARCFVENLTNTCWYVQGANTAEPEPTLTTNALEEDTRVWLHAKATPAWNILVISPDTDTYMYHAQKLYPVTMAYIL